jgi:ribosomal protein L12E/L44/L45/RPP1/RPP2
MEESAAQPYDKEKVMREAAKIFADSNKDIIKEMAKTDSDLVIQEMQRTIDMLGVDAFVEGKFLPYAAACVILAFSGRELNSRNIERLVKSMSVEPDKQMLGLIDTLHYKNHLVYINALYLILVLGRDPTEKLVAQVAAAMDMKPDPEAVKYVMEIYEQKLKKAWG